MAMRRAAATAVLVAMLVPAAPASARAPTLLAPVTPWNLHYADQSCQLLRSFGDPAKPTTMVLERISPDSSLSLMIFGPGLRARMDSGTARAAFLPHAKHRFESANVAETVDTKQSAIVWTTVDLLPGWEDEPFSRKPAGERPVRDLARETGRRTLEAEMANAVTGLEITEPGGRKVILQTGSLGRASAMMKECAREQLKNWGIDPDTQDKIFRDAVSTKSLADYLDGEGLSRPCHPQRQRSRRLGPFERRCRRPCHHCTSLTAYRPPEFAEVVCKNLSKAKFLPAELADGTKVPTYVVTSVRFRMP
jgi:hypothetical protein